MNDPFLRETLHEFAVHMEVKLRKNDHKTGWRKLPIAAIKRLMDIEVLELETAMEFMSSREAMDECLDVANFAMMLHDRLSMEKDKNVGVTK